MPDVVVVYLASPRVNGWQDWTRLDCLEASLKLLRLHAPPWPVVIFHEDYTTEDQQRLLKIAPDITFEKINFTGKEVTHVNHRPDNRVGTYGYCMMCRFFGGQMQNHPLIQAHTHYMRLDDDSYIMSPITTEMVDKMTQADYSYRSLSGENHQGLFDHTVKFMNERGFKVRQPYSTSVPYNNFHISKLSMWKHPLVQDFLNGIDAISGFTQLGWTDASVHKMVTSMLCPEIGLSVYSGARFAYRHNQHCSHDGPHVKYCSDHRGGVLSWGPPACLEAQ